MRFANVLTAGVRLLVVASMCALTGTAFAQDRAREPRSEELRKADRLLARGEYPEARTLYDRVAVREDGAKRTDSTRYKLAFATAKSGDAAGAKATYATLADSTKSPRLKGSALLHQADLSTRAGDHDTATACMERLATESPDHPQGGVALTRIRTNIEKAKSRGGDIPPGLVRAEGILASREGSGRGKGRGRSGGEGPARGGAKDKGCGRDGDDSHGPPSGKGSSKGKSRGDESSDGDSRGSDPGRDRSEGEEDHGKGGKHGSRPGKDKREKDSESGEGDHERPSDQGKSRDDEDRGHGGKGGKHGPPQGKGRSGRDQGDGGNKEPKDPAPGDGGSEEEQVPGAKDKDKDKDKGKGEDQKDDPPPAKGKGKKK